MGSLSLDSNVLEIQFNPIYAGSTKKLIIDLVDSNGNPFPTSKDGTPFVFTFSVYRGRTELFSPAVTIESGANQISLIIPSEDTKQLFPAVYTGILKIVTKPDDLTYLIKCLIPVIQPLI